MSAGTNVRSATRFAYRVVLIATAVAGVAFAVTGDRVVLGVLIGLLVANALQVATGTLAAAGFDQDERSTR